MSLKLTFAPLSDVGRERSENQDAFGSEEAGDLSIFVVCDGMGGQQGGSTAAKLGVETITKVAVESEGDPPARISDALVAANTAIHGVAKGSRELRGMGTTAVVLAIDRSAEQAWIGHVGDSRIYLVRGESITQLTRDHTFVQRLVDDGILTLEAAENHPQGNVIIRSLGGHEAVEVELGDTSIALEEGDVFVLCSDGLHGLIGEQEIASIVRSMAPEDAARTLIDRANEEGGHDNVTVEVVLVGEPSEGVPESFDVRRPGPAPGTRMARMAAESDLDASGDSSGVTAPIEALPPDVETSASRPAAESGSAEAIESDAAVSEVKVRTNTSPTGSSAIPEAPRLKFVAVAAVLLAVVLAAVVLFAMMAGSSESYTPRGSPTPPPPASE